MSKSIYFELESELRLQIDAGQKSQRNLLTALNRISSLLGDDALADLLTPSGAESIRDSITERLTAENTPDASIRSIRSNILKLAALAQSRWATPEGVAEFTPAVVPDADQKTFKQAVRAAIDAYYKDKPAALAKNGVYSIKAALADIEKRTSKRLPYAWLADMAMRARPLKQVNAEARERAKLLEVFLGLKEGELVSRMPISRTQFLAGKREKKFEHKERYALLELPPQLEQQWADLKAFWCHGDAPLRTPSFADDPALTIRLSDGESWKERKADGVVTTLTALNNHSKLRNFYGWLHNECGVALEELDLSMLGYEGLLEQYKVFARKRDGGMHPVLHLYRLCSKFYGEPHSYGSRYHAPKPFKHDSKLIHSVYPNGLPEYRSGAEWAAARLILASNINVAKKELGKHIVRKKVAGEGKNTGGQTNIVWLKEATEGVLEATEKHFMGMLEQLRSWSADPLRHGEGYAARYAASAAFYALEFVRPLRISNMLLMKLLDKPCRDVSRLSHESCWVTSSGDFRVYVPKGCLKNDSGKEIEAVDFTVTTDDPLHGLVQGWLTQRAALLAKNGAATDRLFVKTSTGYVGRDMFYTNDDGVVTSDDSEQFEADSYMALVAYFGEEEAAARGITKGINPHAMRHLVALYNVELTQGDYAYVAHLLMDSVDMILLHYGRNNHAQQQAKSQRIQQERIARLNRAA